MTPDIIKPDYKSAILEKLQGVKAQLNTLKRLDFPYDSSKEAIGLLLSHFKRLAKNISVTNIPESLKQQCQIAQKHIHEFLPVIGMIANSANVRNIFEICEPLLLLAIELFDPTATRKTTKIRLVVSYEWAFSPLIYNFNTGLPNFIIMGLPASESCNPLLLSLAGHELGHTAWKKIKDQLDFQDILAEIESKIRDTIKQHIEDLNNTHKYSNANMPLLSNLPILMQDKFQSLYKNANRQAEEIFCDLYGLSLFHESFLHAMHYFASPAEDCFTGHYPSMISRMELLISSASSLGLPLPRSLLDAYKPHTPHRCGNEDCHCYCDVRSKILPDLINLVRESLRECDKAVYSKDEDQERRIVSHYKRMVPAPGVGKIADIINAGWKVYFDLKKNPGSYDERFTMKTLMELVSKNFEILAMEKRLKTHGIRF